MRLLGLCQLPGSHGECRFARLGAGRVPVHHRESEDMLFVRMGDCMVKPAQSEWR